ncbi:Tafazzin [Hypsibius exemplaris]|uniref:Tafazzin family protein n=1 Tax=Hypsibius exemplaris TaxID=2072580 RepID=A0A9X6RLV1_HYPEX|nr:Tafazzin [Hypsibius exemplaris]
MPNFVWPFPEAPGKLWNTGRGLTIVSIASISKLILALNRLQIHGKERFLDVLENREKGRGLITISNHYCCADDPMLWGMLPWRHLTPKTCRWGMGAAEICFSNERDARFFGLGKIVPIVRGDGIYQRGMQFIMERLQDGDWCHIFPESRVNQEHQWLRLKWGVGRLISEASITPLVLPFFHQGADYIQANRPPFIPTIGKNFTILVGSVLDYRDKVLQMKADGASLTDQRKELTDDLQAVLKDLRYQCEELHARRY